MLVYQVQGSRDICHSGYAGGDLLWTTDSQVSVSREQVFRGRTIRCELESNSRMSQAKGEDWNVPISAKQIQKGVS